MKFICAPGKQRTAWKSPDGQATSPLGSLAALATAEGYRVKPEAHMRFHGYYLHVPTGQKQQGARWREELYSRRKSGQWIRLCRLSGGVQHLGRDDLHDRPDGVSLKKDLRKDTTQTATAMPDFDPIPLGP